MNNVEAVELFEKLDKRCDDTDCAKCAFNGSCVCPVNCRYTVLELMERARELDAREKDD